MKSFEKVLFRDGDFELEVNVSMDESTAYLSVKELSALFERSKPTISQHIKNILPQMLKKSKSTVIKKDAISSDGKTYKTLFYNLDIIREIGKRIKSERGERLRDFIYDYCGVKDTNNGEIIIYNNGAVSLSINVSPKEKTIWMNQNQIADLFQTSIPNVQMHINSILEDKEVEEENCKYSLIVQTEGQRQVTRRIYFYNLDMILAVGYRVKSSTAIAFRRWASDVLSQYLLKGYAIDENRVTISKENYLQLENDVEYIKKEIVDIKEKVFIEPIKQRLFFDGQFFDAREFICSIIAKADKEIVVIDPYFDIKGLSFLTKAKKGVLIKVFLSSKAKLNKHDIGSFKGQYASFTVKFIKNYHDRFLIIDGVDCYAIGTSFNYMGNKSFAVIRNGNMSFIKAILASVGE